MTVSILRATPTWHKNWLRSAAGANHTHGTQFPAYTQGNQLVRIQDNAPGPAASFGLRVEGAVLVECADNERWCEYYDRTIPRATFLESGPAGDDRTIPVTITVEHPLGQWTLQVVAGRYPIPEASS